MLSGTSNDATRKAVDIVAGSDAVRRTLGRLSGGICRKDLQERYNSLLTRSSGCIRRSRLLGLCRVFQGRITDWREGENLFFQPDVPGSFWSEYLKQFAEHGSLATQREAYRRMPLFTPF